MRLLERGDWCPVTTTAMDATSKVKDIRDMMNLLPGGVQTDNSPAAKLPVPEFYDVQHLDYAYIETCRDVKELLDLYAVLK